MADTVALKPLVESELPSTEAVKAESADIVNSCTSCGKHGVTLEARQSFSHGFFCAGAGKAIKITCDDDYAQLMHEEQHSTGGARVLHAFQSDLRHLEPAERDRFAELFLNAIYGETNGRARYVIGIVHGECSYLPDLLPYLSEKHANLTVQVARMTSRNETTATSLAEYHKSVQETYSRGTFRSGPMLQTSLVGKVSEETGTYSEELLDMFEGDPFLRRVLPWGTFSALYNPEFDRSKSDDGPIVWVRPGEQYLPTDFSEYQFGAAAETARKVQGKRQKKSNELDSLKSFFFAAKKERRELLFEDRTRAHADHVDFGVDRRTTAAVGLLKAVHCGQDTIAHDRVVKDVVAFDARDFEKLVTELQLDLHEPPATQCIGWLDEAKLNSLAREHGVRFAQVRLHHDDLYFIPRRVVHQFRTVTAVTSVAWHVRLDMYRDSPTEGDAATLVPAEPPKKRSKVKKAVLYS